MEMSSVLAKPMPVVAAVLVMFWPAPSLVEVKVIFSAVVIDAATLTPAADKAWLRSSSDLTVAASALAS